jgi:ubiquitin-like 1-activating enzyme E1 B
MQSTKSTSNGDAAEAIITFDKDDEDTLDFVTASANIRSLIFGIETKSRFDIKQMAGNIIPAIATTNAIVAGLCVLQSFKVLQSQYARTKEVRLYSSIIYCFCHSILIPSKVFLSPSASERLLASDRYRDPNPDCPVCSPAQTRLAVDLSRATLQDLVEDVLRLQLGYGEEIYVNTDVGTIYDADEEENLTKKLTDLGIQDSVPCFDLANTLLKVSRTVAS